MGVFTCTVCRQQYFDKRFLWEQDLPNSESEASESKQPDSELKQPGESQELLKFTATEDVKLGLEVSLVSQHHMSVVKVAEGSWAQVAGIREGDDILKVNGNDVQVLDMKGIIAIEMNSRPTHLEIRRSNKLQDAVSPIDSIRQYADALRASGTAANITGTVLPHLVGACSPISAVGGICGAAGGVSQLKQGFSMPSGHIDPHLIAKGTLTTGVGTTCAVLGALASVGGPLLLAVALGLGVAGLGTATALDANMSGLCLRCRVEAVDVDGSDVQDQASHFEQSPKAESRTHQKVEERGVSMPVHS